MCHFQRHYFDVQIQSGGKMISLKLYVICMLKNTWKTRQNTRNCVEHLAPSKLWDCIELTVNAYTQIHIH